MKRFLAFQGRGARIFDSEPTPIHGVVTGTRAMIEPVVEMTLNKDKTFEIHAELQRRFDTTKLHPGRRRSRFIKLLVDSPQEYPVWFADIDPKTRLEVLRDHGRVIMQDVTYKTNVYGLYLSVFVVIDSNLNSRLVGQALLSRQATEDHQWAFSAPRLAINASDTDAPARSINERDNAPLAASSSSNSSLSTSTTSAPDPAAPIGLDLDPRSFTEGDAAIDFSRDLPDLVIITDFDQAAQNAVRAVFPNGRPVGCRWHMNVAVDMRDGGRRRAVPRTADDPPNLEKIRKRAREFLLYVDGAQTEEEFERRWRQPPQDLDKRVCNYLTRTWHPKRRLWATWAIGTFFRAGCTTSSRVEGMNGLLKRFGLDTNTRLMGVDSAVGRELIREADQANKMEAVLQNVHNCTPVRLQERDLAEMPYDQFRELANNDMIDDAYLMAKDKSLVDRDFIFPSEDGSLGKNSNGGEVRPPEPVGPNFGQLIREQVRPTTPRALEEDLDAADADVLVLDKDEYDGELPPDDDEEPGPAAAKGKAPAARQPLATLSSTTAARSTAATATATTTTTPAAIANAPMTSGARALQELLKKKH
ncbi:hypothetical protein H9P43_004958 [Blastocladiella emersonii ATCC 22665]|nr:hypothetical protein H9P43_004958 [Blastocladiella emersonii ATCC 22665]